MNIKLQKNIQYFLRSFRGTDTWTKCRSRHKTDTDRNRLIQYRCSKVSILNFIRPVYAGLFLFSADLVPGPAFCPGAGATEKQPEIL